MSFRDFATYFKRVEIVNLPSETTGGISWGNNSMQGSWRKKVNAGGCRNFPGNGYKINIYKERNLILESDVETHILKPLPLFQTKSDVNNNALIRWKRSCSVLQLLPVCVLSKHKIIINTGNMNTLKYSIFLQRHSTLTLSTM